MGQPGRGGVWEESVITTPPHSQIVALSATLPNALELANWMEAVTGRRTVLVQANGGRPVPLRYLFATKKGLYPLFRDADAGPGAPRGMLGLRGDGVPSKKEIKTRQQQERNGKAVGTGGGGGGFGEPAKSKAEEGSKIPKGLQVNPVLTAQSKKRLLKVDREIERRKAEARMNRQEEELMRLAGDGRRGGRGGGRMYNRGPLSPREEQRERDRLLRRELGKSVPSMSTLLKRLEQRDLLPAIMFLFSRAGCDDTASLVCQQMQGPSRDPMADINDDYDDDDDDDDEDHDDDAVGQGERNNNKSKNSKKKQKKGRGRSQRYKERENGLIEDDNGRSFRRSSNYIGDEVMDAVLDGSRSDEDFGLDYDESSLSSDNWHFYAGAGLLNLDEIEEVARRVAAFNSDNEEIAFDDNVAEQFLYGVGAHHAGMLPAHKAFVETLYRAQLMKVVFATETLAAGINMPARTTCICNMAKRGDGGTMNLLETSNLLQMAGRAGRRGMDTDGTCVILSTPFESEDEAVTILTNEVKPVRSQFTPSYSLAINLIARGNGKLDVAKQLVEKSFAVWERKQLEQKLGSAEEEQDEQLSELMRVSNENQFLEDLCEAFRHVIAKSQDAGIDVDVAMDDMALRRENLELQVELLGDRKLIKTASKSYIGGVRKLDIEKKTMGYLQDELQSLPNDATEEDRVHVQEQVDEQRVKVKQLEKNFAYHVFNAIAKDANDLMDGPSDRAVALRASLQKARSSSADGPLLADEIVLFAKSAVTIKKKQSKAGRQAEATKVLVQAKTKADKAGDTTWEDMLGLTNVLICYGCLDSDDLEMGPDGLPHRGQLESSLMRITQAGEHVGMLSLENSLWGVIAMGGAWDVVGASRGIDTFRDRMASFEANLREDGDGLFDDLFDREDDLSSAFAMMGDDDNDDSTTQEEEEQQQHPAIRRAREEAMELQETILKLTPYEMAGYVACLVSEGYRRNGPGFAESFQTLTSSQQAVVRATVSSSERLVEIQRLCGLDGSRFELDLSQCQVVTAWAGGCSWSEALEISGSAPGDQARMLGRVLDALRQFGNLPYSAARASDFDGDGLPSHPRGVNQEIRTLCRDAARGIDRYPVKDPLPYGTDDTEVEADFQDDGEEEEEEEAANAEIEEMEANDEEEVENETD